jgi:hypothetical protein
MTQQAHDPKTMKPCQVKRFDPAARAAAKRASREADARALASGAISAAQPHREDGLLALLAIASPTTSLASSSQIGERVSDPPRRFPSSSLARARPSSISIEPSDSAKFCRQ